MRDEEKTKDHLIKDLRVLRKRLAELEEFETAHLRIEEELLKFSHVVAQSPSAIIITDTTGSIEYVNPKFTEITDYTIEEVLGKNPRLLKSGKTTPEEYAYLWNTISSGMEWRGEFCNKKKNGEFFWEYASISPVHHFNGTISHYVAIKEDITERKKAEDELRAAKLYTDNIIKSMANALVVITPDAKIRTVNTAACELLEYAEEELIGRSVDAITSNEMPFINTLLKLIEQGSIKNHEMSCRTKSGKDIPVCINATAMYNEDISPRKTIGIVFNIRDVREMKQMQKQLIQSAKMASLGTLAAGVAHEIKNPLAIILQGIEYLKCSLSSDASLLDVAERINRAVLRADRIVKGLLNFSRQTPFKFAETDIASVVEESISFVELQASRKNITLIRQFAPDLPKVMVDSDQMKQVFINIFNNACEAMSQGGTIAISLEQIRGGDSKNYLRIKFTDNGCGIPEKDLQDVFDPFFSTKQKDGNSGLGLSIIKGIVDGHLGTINIESAPGKGTSVIIKLPFVT